MTHRTTRRVTATALASLTGLMAFGASGGEAANSLAMVNVQEAGVRTGPSYDGTSLIKTKHYGDCVEALTGPNPSGGYNWFQVRVGSGGTGWMRADLVDGAGC